MKRSEMLTKIEEALENSFGSDPYTGQVLYPPTSYMSHVVLRIVEEYGMLPPTNTCRLVPDESRGGLKHSPTKREWDEEVQS